MLDAFGTQGDGSYLRQIGRADLLDYRAGFAADNLQEQRGSTLHGATGQLPIHATLEAMRGVGVEAIGASLASHCDGVEESTLEEQIASLGAHATVLSTHHTGDGQSTLVVGDHQGVGAQGDFLAVQQDYLLAFFRHAHADTAFDLVQIEGMHGLAEFEHHVVGDVDCRVDAADIGATQTLDHPQRSRAAQVDIADYTTEVTRAGLGSE
ncbi:hypothetical protein D3C81_1476920 [compost metagenome]